MGCELTLLDGTLPGGAAGASAASSSRWPCGTTGPVRWLDHDLIAGAPLTVEGPVAIYSGTPGQDRFTPDPLAWLGPARAALASALEELDAAVMIRPHHAHVLSDVPGTRSLLADRGPQPVALDVAALLSPSMLADPEPHLDRIMQGLGPMAGALLLMDARVGDDGRTMAAGPGEGEIPGHLLGRAVDAWLKADGAPNIPVAVTGDDLDTAARWLGWL